MSPAKQRVEIAGRTLAVSNLEKVLFPEVGFTKAQVIDYYVRIASNDYSVDPSVVGRFVDVVADLTHVTITCAGTVVGRHRRCWARHQTITDPAHRQAADQLRRDRLTVLTPPGQVDVEQRRLSDYDLVFGVTDAGSAEAAS